MSNARRKCKLHKTYTDEWVKLPVGTFCTFDAAIEFANSKADKDRKRLAAKAKKDKDRARIDRKKKFYDNDLKTRKAAAKTACHSYIRERDKDLPCICCGRPLGNSYDAGHFLESGNNPLIRYDENNIHAQSVYCNQYSGGNSDDYEGRLRIKIGDEAVDKLKQSKGGTIKRTCDDYRKIESYYKDKLQALKGN